MRVSRLAVPRLDMKSSAAAGSETATFGLLQQDDADQRRDDHQVDYDNNGVHLWAFHHKHVRADAPAAGWVCGV